MSESYLHSARKSSAERFDNLRADLEPAHGLTGSHACVYATGSFGRLEAGQGSDLDLFIVVDTETSEKDGKPFDRPLLSGLDEIKLKFHLINAVEQRDIAEFDGDGKFLKVHTVKDFTENLGSPEDDSKNTFTGRLLMLLESRPLLGDAFYHNALEQVISAYFIDYDDNEHNFIPAFLANDIMRMWRTFCVNYEFYRTKGSIKSKIKNLKLKHSRMLTCYSAIIYLLALYSQRGTVRPEDVRLMVSMTPAERLEEIAQESFSGSTADPVLKENISEALLLYSDYLALVHKGEQHLEQQFNENEKQLRDTSRKFGRKLAEVIALIDAKAKHHALYRFILI